MVMPRGRLPPWNSVSTDQSAVSITEMVQSLMEPMKDEIAALRRAEAVHNAANEDTRLKVDEMDRRWKAAISYIRQLHIILRDNAIIPPDTPTELDGVDLT